ncbi:MAG: DUF4130 domain-containing protein [Candidatus Helarchaeota archaeon]|nr:DUF4130 domain-containing protein [Candidatus Helarchaeota archaeon]
MSCTTGINLNKDSVEYFLEMAQRHRKSQRDDLVSRVKTVLERDPAIIQNKVTKIAREFYRRGKEVMNELYRLNAFIRFEVYPEYLLVSEIRSEHDIIDLMFPYFWRRYPDFIILLNDKEYGFCSTKRSDIQFSFSSWKCERNYWIFKRDQYTLAEIRTSIAPQLQHLFDVDTSSSIIWEKYYDSQYIKDRKNIKLARKALPKKMIKESVSGLSYEAKRLDEEENDRQKKNSLLKYL